MTPEPSPDRDPTPDEGVAALAGSPIRRVQEAARSATEGYSPHEERPLGGYVASMTAYVAALGAVAAVASAKGHSLPERTSWGDLALMTVATHKLTRIISKEAVTSPLRAPFTRYTGVSGPAELREEVRHTGGIRHSIGELLTCPFCLSVWVASGFTVGMAVAPRATRAAATAMTAVFGSDVLQFAYAKLEQSS